MVQSGQEDAAERKIKTKTAMSKLLILLLLLSCIGFTPGCDQPVIVSVELLSNRNVSLAKGQVLEIKLESNPTTGYSWQVSGVKESNVLDQVGKPEYQSDSNLVGAGGTEKYRFRAMEKGNAELVFEYRRPWEKGKAPARKYVVGLTVQ